MPAPLPSSHPYPSACETVPRERRSVFANFGPSTATEAEIESVEADAAADDCRRETAEGGADLALARSFLLQFLARAFDYPTTEAWAWLTTPATEQGLAGVVTALEPDPRAALRLGLEALLLACQPETFELFHDAYVRAIGHAARGSCPINEIEYGDLKADPLFQPHRLADLAGFYHAFGLEVSTLSDERLDHLAVELEFMAVLAAQEASLLSTDGGSGALRICREAQRRFLREHLGRWTPAFARRLHRAVGDGPLGALALFALASIEFECHRLGLNPGSEDLLLRPADEAASLCEGCGLAQTLPGAPTAPRPE